VHAYGSSAASSLYVVFHLGVTETQGIWENTSVSVRLPEDLSISFSVTFIHRAKALLRAFLIRIALLLVGCAVLIIAIGINLNAGREILTGLFSPSSSFDIVISVARLAAPALGLWLLYRGVR
jgi:hypothetical protein